MLAQWAFVAVAAAADLAGAALVTTAHRWGRVPLRYFVATGAGFMLAAAFIRMLPESAHVPHAYLFVLIGYFGIHLFEHTVAPHFHFGEEVHAEAFLKPSAGWLAMLGLGVHTFFDGVTIAAGFMIGPALGLLFFMAVLLHKLPEGFTVASIMLATGRSRTAALLAGLALGVFTVLGALATTVLVEAHVGYALAPLGRRDHLRGGVRSHPGSQPRGRSGAGLDGLRRTAAVRAGRLEPGLAAGR
jgi:zinc transporter ZupT